MSVPCAMCPEHYFLGVIFFNSGNLVRSENSEGTFERAILEDYWENSEGAFIKFGRDIS